MSIADTGRFWEILVIPVLQILEDSGKYWLYQYCRYWKIRYEVAECTCILFFIRKNIVNLFLPVGLTYISSLHLSPFPLPPLFSFLSVSLFTVRPLITDTQTGHKK
jgi:hypothetical protein